MIFPLPACRPHGPRALSAGDGKVYFADDVRTIIRSKEVFCDKVLQLLFGDACVAHSFVE